MCVLPPIHTLQTGVWGMLVKVREQFLTPLRSLLVATRAHCKREVEMRREEALTGKGRSTMTLVSVQWEKWLMFCRYTARGWP